MKSAEKATEEKTGKDVGKGFVYEMKNILRLHLPLVLL
jgi:hypothetical protein